MEGFDEQAVFQAAAHYIAAHGWTIARLYRPMPDGSCACGGRCSAVGKHPYGEGWQNKGATSEEMLDVWFEDTSQPFGNIGVMLGARSGVIDIEADNEAGEEIIREFGLDNVPTVTYSAGRGLHRLFKYEPEWMPDVGVIKFRDILEVRIGGSKGTQSVIPPSWHAKSGREYAWKEGFSPDEIEPAPLPENFKKALLEYHSGKNGPTGTIQNAIKKIVTTEAKSSPGDRHELLLGVVSFLASKCRKFDEEEYSIVTNILMAVNQTRCVPPKEDKQIISLVESQMKFYEKKRKELSTTKTELHFKDLGLEYDELQQCWFPGEWRLKQIRSDPGEFVIIIPCKRGDERPYEVRIGPADYEKPHIVADMIAAQTNGDVGVRVPNGAAWARMWGGESIKTKTGERVEITGLMKTLKDDIEEVYPTIDYSMFAGQAGVLLSYLDSHSKEEEFDGEPQPSQSGLPKWLKDKDGEWGMWLSLGPTFHAAWERVKMKQIEESGRRKLIEKIIELSGGVPFEDSVKKGDDGKQHRWVILRDKHINAIRRIAHGTN